MTLDLFFAGVFLGLAGFFAFAAVRAAGGRQRSSTRLAILAIANLVFALGVALRMTRGG